MQPFPSKSSAWKRVQDIELMHMRFALEFTVFAIGAMELCPGDKNDYQFATAVFFLREMQNHLEAISNVSRKIFMVSIISALLHMDNVSINLTQAASCGVYPVSHERLDRDITTEGRNNMAVSFVGLLLDILRRNLPLPSAISEIERSSNTVLPTAGRKALEWRLSNAKHFLEDWEWRLSVLQRLRPVSGLQWGWKEALVFLRATPSKLLNLCMQRAKYDIAEEAVQRFSLPPEDKVALQMAEWMTCPAICSQVEDTLSHVAEGTPNAVRKLDILSFRTQLGPLATILLCIDVAASSARSRDMCKLLLDQASARSMLSEIFPGRSPKIGSAYWDQIQEVAIISVTKRILQRLHDLLEQETSLTLRETFAGEMAVSTPNESSRIGQRQRALVILHQMIDDAFKGKRQFLSGKLHNLARVVTDEDAETNYPKGEGFDYDKKGLFSSENGVVVGLGLRVLKQVTKPALKTSPSVAESSSEIKDSAKRLFGPITTKPSAYLSNFIIYVATIGDIVDGIDTTHDFNFFSLVYEWPKDLLTRLMFERGSIDAAGKVADVMGVDFVHQVISACVPPVFPSRSTHGWACIPFVPMDSGSKLDLTKTDTYGAASAAPQKPLYPLQPNVVNNLAKFSPVRAILACTFGSRMLLSDSELAVPGHLKDALGQAPDTERLFSEFVLEQSERFPTLIRWIQMQSNLHRVSESAVTAKSNNEAAPAESKEKVHLKRIHDSESDTESDDDGEVIGSHFTSTSQSHTVSDSQLESPAPCDNVKHDLDVYISFDSENEGSLKNRVERFIQEGKLMDALALSDRFLRNGASDRLLHLLIEREEENNPVMGGYGSHKFGSTTWQYCLRLTDKQLAARVALKYLHRWDLHAAIDVLTMCSCHLPESDLRNEVLQRRQALQKYSHILSADDHYSSWQEVEAECKRDSEGLALRLAAKGAVSAALEVAESPSTSIDLRRELQGRQLLLPDLRSKQLLVHFFLKRTVGNLSDTDIARLNSWALGLRVLALLPLPSQQRCSALHEHPQLILEVLLMMKQLEDAALILKEVPSLRNDNLIRSYAEKAIAINVDSAPRVQRISISGSGSKQKGRAGTSTSRSNFAQSKGNLLREARRSVSWASRDTGTKSAAKDVYRKRKSSGIAPTERVPSEALGGIPDERASSYSFDGQERHPFVPVTEEWVLTGGHNTDEKIRSSHKYKTSPDITLFKALLSLCSDEAVSAKGALELCVSQMKIVLSSQHLPLMHLWKLHLEPIMQQKLTCSQLRKFSGSSDLSSNSERSRDADDASADSASSSTGSQCLDELSELLAQADIWLGRAELLQSLLGSGIVASLDDIADKESSAHLRDRLIQEERYSVAVYTCKKCKIDAFPVWNAWGRALIRMEHYAQARVKYKQALQLYKGDVSPVILEIINTVEGGPPVDVLSARSMYEHFAKSASTILDDSLSADAYLNILYMPSTFPRSERSRQSRDASEGHSLSSSSEFEDGPRSNLDNVRYAECIYYLQEYARPQMLAFMFRHGRYDDACSLFFSFPQSSSQGTTPPTQRADPLATDYGPLMIYAIQYINTALARICNYCETHRHFNYLYKFLVIKGDHVAAGLCCLQLFMNSMSQEEALKHLDMPRYVHFEEALSARDRAVEATKLVSKTVRGKSASEKLTKEMIVKFLARVSYQVDIVKSLNSADGPQWKTSLLEIQVTLRHSGLRRCVVAETLAEKHFDLAFQVICDFNLPAVDIYAGIAASLAERKKGGQLTEFLKNIKGTTEPDDWDQVLGAAINVYANKHKERPDRLIDMLISNHRKVLACVVCGRLKSAFQIASRSGSVADVQYVAHQALHANALPVLDMCKQWLAQYM
uniref:ZFYVE26-like TPR repeats domain-containing protein n=1 Tax=Ananas comosus var. bracteatus TaxID=296719 RepID=A0A6V7P066_ANACO|nr:unnamed protein product [Ananas comosus var. bracteatus]